MSAHMQWQLHQDGSYDLIDGSVSLRGCYPALDGAAVRPLRVSVVPSVTGGTLRYVCSHGELELVLDGDSTGLILQATFSGAAYAPHWVLPLAGARVEGADRIFRQGCGMGGQTQFLSLPLQERTDSHLLVAFVAPGEATLVISARDYRRFALRAAIYPEQGETRAGSFELGFATERIPLQDRQLALPLLHITGDGTPAAALGAAAREIGQAMQTRTHLPTFWHWCSWYYLYQHLSEQLLEEYLAGFARVEPPLGFQSVQIDAGYCPANGDWLEAGWRWPSGLESAFRKIAVAGYRPGVWIAPFMVGSRSRLFREHPEWMLRDNAGELLAPWRHYGEYRVWGYHDEETYLLDSSHPEAFAYLRQVFRTFRSWGVSYFKTDFLYWGLHDSTAVRRHTPGKTGVEYLRDVLEMIRTEIGEDSYWLGCIAPFAPCLGLVDAMRIAGDVSDNWGASQNVILETVGDQYFNNVWWQNDPDAILVRDFHISMTEQELTAFALWQAIMGGVVNTSDPVHQISADRLQLLRFLRPGPEKGTAQIRYWGQNRLLRIAIREYPALQARAVLILNPTDNVLAQRLTLAELIGRASAGVFAWTHRGATPLGHLDHLLPELAAHSAALYFISDTDTPPPAGFTLNGALTPDTADRASRLRKKETPER